MNTIFLLHQIFYLILSFKTLEATTHDYSGNQNRNRGRRRRPEGSLKVKQTVTYKLHRHLLEGYRKTTRPVQHSTEPVLVTAYTSLYQLIELDQARNLIVLAGSFEFYWHDDYLMWDPDDYEGATEMYFSSKEIWIPEISLYYSHHHKSSVVIKTSNNARVNYTGHVRYYIPFTTKSMCPTDVKTFPFDGQQCTLFFGSWAHNNESLDFDIWADSKIDLRDYFDNQEWEIDEEKTTVKQARWLYTNYIPPETWTVLELTIVTRRTSFYYVFILVIPSTIITLVAVVGFHMPSNSGRMLDAKFRLGINTLLSMSLILLVVVEDMPHFSMSAKKGKRGSSSGVPLIGLFYFSLILLIGTSTITTSFFVLLHRNLRVRKRMPWYLGWMTIGWQSVFAYGYKNADTENLECDEIPTHRRELSRRLAVSQYENMAIFNYFYEILEDLAGAIKRSEIALQGIRSEIVTLVPKDDIENKWAVLIRRLELLSLVVYLSLLGLFLLFFFYHDWWYGH